MLSLYWNVVYFVTNLGDAAILLPTGLVVLLSLLAFKDYRIAAAWGLTVGSCLIVMVILKLIFRTCGTALTHNEIVSPSGHTALSTTIYGALGGFVVARTADLRLKIAASFGAGVLAIAIALSRIAIGVHDVAEVVVGLSVGVCFIAVFCFRVSRLTRPKTPILFIVAASAILILTFYGRHMNIESFFEYFATRIRVNTGICDN